MSEKQLKFDRFYLKWLQTWKYIYKVKRIRIRRKARKIKKNRLLHLKSKWALQRVKAVLALKAEKKFRRNRTIWQQIKMLLGYARLAKALINKKENFLMKSLFFNLDYKNKFNYLLKPINEFEKQFLFKKPLYDNIINEAKVQTTFIKNSYNLGRNSGINYYTRGDLVLENKDIKDPLFYVRENYIINKYIMCDNFFCLDINKHIFFFLLIDFYKILVVIYLYKLINF